VADSRLGGQVDHELRLSPGEHRRGRRRIGQVRPVEREPLLGLEDTRACALQADVVVVVQVVDSVHHMALPQESQTHVKADETRGSGDENHGHFR
jgi:hypothetical protein